jgi:hypothetical protein
MSARSIVDRARALLNRGVVDGGEPYDVAVLVLYPAYLDALGRDARERSHLRRTLVALEALEIRPWSVTELLLGASTRDSRGYVVGAVDAERQAGDASGIDFASELVEELDGCLLRWRRSGDGYLADHGGWRLGGGPGGDGGTGRHVSTQVGVGLDAHGSRLQLTVACGADLDLAADWLRRDWLRVLAGEARRRWAASDAGQRFSQRRSSR